MAGEEAVAWREDSAQHGGVELLVCTFGFREGGLQTIVRLVGFLCGGGDCVDVGEDACFAGAELQLVLEDVAADECVGCRAYALRGGRMRVCSGEGDAALRCIPR